MPQDPSAAVSPLPFVLQLHRAGQRADRAFARQAGNGLTLPQFMVLQVLTEGSGPSQTEIMTATGIDRSSVADLVKRLVGYGWVQRRRTRRDARVYAVRLTEEGKRILALAIPAARATEQILLCSFSTGQRRVLLKALLTLANDNRSSIE
jgi:DNA-binding MarR family transcriptional regulator